MRGQLFDDPMDQPQTPSSLFSPRSACTVRTRTVHVRTVLYQIRTTKGAQQRSEPPPTPPLYQFFQPPPRSISPPSSLFSQHLRRTTQTDTEEEDRSSASHRSTPPNQKQNSKNFHFLAKSTPSRPFPPQHARLRLPTKPASVGRLPSSGLPRFAAWDRSLPPSFLSG